MISKYLAITNRFRYLVVFVTLLFVALASTQITKLEVITDYRVFFGPDNPELKSFEEVEDIYGDNEGFIVALHLEEGDFLNSDALKILREFTKESWELPYSSRIDSVSNVLDSYADPEDLDNLIVNTLVPDGEITAKDIERVKDRLENDPTIPRMLSTKDFKTMGILIRISFPDNATSAQKETVAALRKLNNKFRSKYPQLSIYASGGTLLTYSFAEVNEQDLPLIAIVMFLLLAAAIWYFLRSFQASLLVLSLVVCTLALALGISGYFGTKLDSSSIMCPIIILTIAVADAIHILSIFFKQFNSGAEKYRALIFSMRANFLAVLLTSLTTSIGFLSLNFSDSPPFHTLGNVSALGAVVAWLLSITFLPAIILILPFKQKHGPLPGEKGIELVSIFAVNRYKGILFFFAVLTIVSCFSISKLKINDKFHELFSTRLPYRQATDFVNDRLGGMYGIFYSLETNIDNGICNPEFLKVLDELESDLKEVTNMAYITGLPKIMKKLSRSLNQENPDFYRIPESTELCSQYLLLYEMGLPFGRDLTHLMNIRKSSLRYDLFLSDADLIELEKVRSFINAWAKDRKIKVFEDEKGTSPSLMFMGITERNIQSMVIGAGLGFLLISLILFVALGNLKLALLSLVPNILPSIITYGLWYFINGEIGFVVSITFSLSLGIIVDDTVHFLTKYKMLIQEDLSVEDALKKTLNTIGIALFATSVILVLGFAAMGLSRFKGTALMGLLTSITFAVALFTDFFIATSFTNSFKKD